jgi:hypothetical protein
MERNRKVKLHEPVSAGLVGHLAAPVPQLWVVLEVEQRPHRYVTGLAKRLSDQGDLGASRTRPLAP